jgi:Family of unknown function (DUF6279)
MILHSMAPSPPPQHESWLKRALLYSALGALLTGCSALTLTYTYAPRLLLWKIDRYFQLSDEQDKLVKGRLADLHTWHRQTELPRYAEFLRQVQDRWRDGVSAEEIEWVFDTFAKLRAELAGRVASAGAVFLPTVDAKQIKHLDRVMQRDNREWLSQAGARAEERAAKRAKTVLGWLRDWLGALTPEQEALVARLVREMPDRLEETLAYRTQRQQQIIQLLQSKPNADVIEHALSEWLATPEKNSPPAYALSVQQFRQEVKKTVLAIDRTVTPRQRNHATDKLQKLITEIQRLAAG